MKHLSKDELSLRLSRYLDGDLNTAEAKELEEYIAAHAEAVRELGELKRLKHLLASKNPVSPNPHFWTGVAAALDAKAKEDENLLPFPRKYAPAVAALGVTVAVAIGVVVFIQREPLMEYFSEQSQAVQQAYESGILKGSILPLFTHLDNDEVLQFAVYGTLPLDKQSETALRVDEASDQGYRIEVGLTAEQRPKQVTVHELLSEIRPSLHQAEKISSVLDEARQKIEKAAFYAENNALAIDPELTQLNKAVLSDIVAVLEPIQRHRFDMFLSKRNAPFALASEGSGAPASRLAPAPRERRVPAMKDFIVITEDSLVVTGLHFNIDSLMNLEMPPMHAPGRPVDFQRNLERLVRSRAHRKVVVRTPVHGSHLPIRISGDEDFFKIEIEPEFIERKSEAARVWIKARKEREKFFRFEFRSSDAGAEVIGIQGPDGKLDINVSIQIDSIVRQAQEEQMKRMQEFWKMDSLFREQSGPSGRVRRRPVPAFPDQDSVKTPSPDQPPG
ncbi:MAG: hypothetical protein HYW57_10505 [Ignavibacteriales bacterium]|nr:hypothetical protein [Ignavibacteriales bacterium]